MIRLPPETASPAPGEDVNLRRIAKLERINAALMAHVERSMDQQGGAYSLFQTATMLEGIAQARAAIDSGAALAKLEQLVTRTHALAA